MNLNLTIGPLVSLVAGILILMATPHVPNHPQALREFTPLQGS